MPGDYSTKKLSDRLLREVKESLSNLDYGSVEIYVTEGEVAQITRRQIKKMSDKK